jgi:hypothetical protein
VAKGSVKIRITFEALAVISNMRYRCNEVGELYGDESPEYVAMLGSLVAGLHHLMQHGGKVESDHEDEEQLSLIGGTFVVWRLSFVREDGRRLLGRWVFYR